MKYSAIIKMKNLQSLLSQCLSLEDYSCIPAHFFLQTPDVSLTLPDYDIHCTGFSEIQDFFQNYKERKQLSGCREFHLLNSPSICPGSSGNPAVLTSSWMSISFAVRCTEKESEIRMFSSRFDAEFGEENGDLKIKSLNWYEYASLTPWKGAPFCSSIISDDWKKWTGNIISQEDYLSLQYLSSRAMQEQISPEDGRPFSMLMSPVLTADENTGSGRWLALTFNSNMQILRLSLNLIEMDFVRSDNIWEIAGQRSQTLVPLSEMRASANTPPQAAEMTRGMRSHPLTVYPYEASDLTDVTEIENIAAEWVSAIRTRAPFYFYEHCLDSGNPDLYFSVIQKTPGIAGFFKECAMMVRMDQLQPKFPGNHTLCTPLITFNEDRTQAVGIWFDFGWTVFGGAFGKEQPPYYALPNIARYEHYFVKKDNKWKLWGFNWGPLYQNGDWWYDPQTSCGWSASPDMRRWPQTFDKYQYQADAISSNEFANNEIATLLPQSF
ncbi:MAG: nuclear transport factor 2 family protein [Clostridiales bacterium]|nr:nuclear transport factor 2 family protein [Clostridiales bacterium]